ncbi:MAG: hypothetical protein ACRDVM_04590 [Acidimicrobiia bacterium]
MNRVAGRIRWSPADLDAFLLGLARPLPTVHNLRLPDPDAHPSV